MTERTASDRLLDIIQAIDALQTIFGGEAGPEILDQLEKLWVMERGLLIVSEASKHVPVEMKERHPTLPWRQIADFGNVLRHAYDRVDTIILWQVLVQDLPPLKAAVEQLYREFGPAS